MIDFDFTTDELPQKGSVLISEPFLSDDYFTRSVVYLCDHNEDGSFGFILNKFVDTNLSKMIKGFPSIDFHVSAGGPVDQGNLFYIHDFGDQLQNTYPVTNGLFIGGDFEQVKSMITRLPGKAKRIRFFIGYSGWDKGQLEAELKEKSWVVLNGINKETILNTENDHLWKDLMSHLGGKFKLMTRFPKNPSDN